MPTFLIYTFKDPELLARVAGALHPHRVLVHVDAKVDEKPFRAAVAGQMDRVEFLDDRVVVNWAGWSQLTALRRLVRRALDTSTSADDYIVMLSGSDYPLRSMPALTRFFDAHRGQQFLRAFDIVASGSEHYRREIENRHFRDLPILRRRTTTPRVRRMRNAMIRALEAVARALPARKPPAGLVPAHGGTHFALTAGCLAELEESVTPEIERYFARVFCPEESFYHSLLASGVGEKWGWRMVPFEGRGQHQYANLHHIEPSLEKVYTEADWPEVRDIDRFFIRKVQSAPSASLLDLIDGEMRCEPPRA